MIEVRVDKEELKELVKQKVTELIKKTELEYVFWDSKELRRRTCLSWTTIKAVFFYDPRFPKYRVGTKWLFPAVETQEFLLVWLKEQPRR